MARWVKITSLFVATLLMIAACVGLGIHYYFSSVYQKKASIKVLKMPSMSRSYPSAPYAGLHPSQISRPADPFHYPIAWGETGPVSSLYMPDLQYPFLCETQDSGLGQPLVDNQEGFGIPIYREGNDGQLTEEVMGYSKDCRLPTNVHYFYFTQDLQKALPYHPEIPKDQIAQIQLENGETVDFVVRMETGTINRFIYTILMLKGKKDLLTKPDTSYWNQKLVYHFGGGVGIGKRQGKLNQWDFIEKMKEPLSMGYVVAFSTGNQTSTHYHMTLAEEVMTRVKRQVIANYGNPIYTVGLGGSGGAIQQLLIAQNQRGLLDAAFLLYSYPDMISQTIYAYDCELLEYYFDVKGQNHPTWGTFENRQWVEGLKAKADFKDRFYYYYWLARAINGIKPFAVPGMSECSRAWRGLTQLTNNPHFTHKAAHYSKEVLHQTHWTHWDDLVDVYGLDQHGFAHVAWDNVGVQYGLGALGAGKMTPDEFIHLNQHIGSWKPAHAYTQEKFWKITEGTSLWEISPWGEHNMQLAMQPDEVAPRTKADSKVIRAAYLSGHVFLGALDIPILDVRHYLEDELDMHHLSASFSTRTRIQEAMGYSDHHILWVSPKPHLPIKEGLQAIDQWLKNRRQFPHLSAGLTKPFDLNDRCYNGKGELLAEGATVWDGDWNEKSPGFCAKIYPWYHDSRLVAGAPWRGDHFKCALKPVEVALKDGTYHSIPMDKYAAQLARIFPDGVCDYRQPSLGSVDAAMVFPRSQMRFAID